MFCNFQKSRITNHQEDGHRRPGFALWIGKRDDQHVGTGEHGWFLNLTVVFLILRNG